MDERDGRDDRLSQRPPAEGVRIIRADEAQAALEAGQAAGRRPDDELRFGDVPPAPSGPRPTHRFPRPGTADPASAPPPPEAAGEAPGRGTRGGTRSGTRPFPGMDPSAPAAPTWPDPVPAAPIWSDPVPGGQPWPDPAPAAPTWSDPAPAAPTWSDPAAGDQVWSLPVASAGPPTGEGPPPEDDDPYAPPRQPDLALPESGIPLQAGSGPELPHWTDPPTGEIPRIGREPTAEPDDDMAAWQALGARGPRWRGSAADWDDSDDVAALGDEEPRLGALDTTRSEHSDLYSFDEQFERIEEEHSGQQPLVGADATGALPRPAARRAAPAAGGHRGSGRSRPGSSPLGGGGGRDLTSAAAVGVGLVIVLGIAYLAGALAMMLLGTVVVLACGLELYNVLQRSGFRPATLLGLCAIAAVMLAAYWRGEPALPLVLVLVFVTSLLWYMLEVVEARPVVNVAVTVMAFVWVGVLGSYASLLVRVHNGRGLLLWAVLVTVVADIVAYAAGTYMGSHPLAPSVSPGKTWEGAIVGGIAAIVVGGLIAGRFTPWSTSSGLKLGLVVALVAPIGDLCESMVKRDLHLKNSGSLLPGHGGMLDRFDSLLFTLPATYYLVQYLRLH